MHALASSNTHLVPEHPVSILDSGRWKLSLCDGANVAFLQCEEEQRYARRGDRTPFSDPSLDPIVYERVLLEMLLLCRSTRIGGSIPYVECALAERTERVVRAVAGGVELWRAYPLQERGLWGTLVARSTETVGEGPAIIAFEWSWDGSRRLVPVNWIVRGDVVGLCTFVHRPLVHGFAEGRSVNLG